MLVMLVPEGLTRMRRFSWMHGRESYIPVQARDRPGALGPGQGQWEGKHPAGPLLPSAATSILYHDDDDDSDHTPLLPFHCPLHTLLSVSRVLPPSPRDPQALDSPPASSLSLTLFKNTLPTSPTARTIPPVTCTHCGGTTWLELNFITLVCTVGKSVLLLHTPAADCACFIQ